MLGVGGGWVVGKDWDGRWIKEREPRRVRTRGKNGKEHRVKRCDAGVKWVGLDRSPLGTGTARSGQGRAKVRNQEM